LDKSLQLIQAIEGNPLNLKRIEVNQGRINDPFIHEANLPVNGAIIHFEFNQRTDIGTPDAQLFCETAGCCCWITLSCFDML
jgi:hypothetical protein